MKKFAIIFIVCVSALLLAACGGDTAAEPETAVNQPETSANAAVPPMNTAAPNANAPTQDAQQTDSARLKATAKEYVGLPVEELFAAIGEPISADYASSCLGPGEDGELVYDGFVVYSYKENDSEVVHSVE